jgi:nitroreductase
MDKETKEAITEILKISVNAPSGHNCQPWRFVLKGDNVFIWNIPGKDKTLFNYNQRGSLIAHGCLIENIFITASRKGYEVDINLFPEEKNPNLVALLNFKKGSANYPYTYLYPFITKRVTNRKPYKKVPFETKDERRLKEFFEKIKKKNFDIVLTQKQEEISLAAQAFSVADKLLFENFYIHKALFDNVNWTLKEEIEKREGLYVGTKELSFLERVLFRYLLSNWNTLQKLNKIGVSEKAAQKRKKLYEQCSAIGLILAPSDSPQYFVKSGRVVQLLWLTATSLGLSFQPISVGLLYLSQGLQEEDMAELTTKQKKFIKEAYQKIIDIFKISERVPTFSFRIGYAEPPTVVSLKKLPDITYYDS